MDFRKHTVVLVTVPAVLGFLLGCSALDKSDETAGADTSSVVQSLMAGEISGNLVSQDTGVIPAATEEMNAVGTAPAFGAAPMQMMRRPMLPFFKADGSLSNFTWDEASQSYISTADDMPISAGRHPGVMGTVVMTNTFYANTDLTSPVAVSGSVKEAVESGAVKSMTFARHAEKTVTNTNRNEVRHEVVASDFALTGITLGESNRTAVLSGKQTVVSTHGGLSNSGSWTITYTMNNVQVQFAAETETTNQVPYLSMTGEMTVIFDGIIQTPEGEKTVCETNTITLTGKPEIELGGDKHKPVGINVRTGDCRQRP